jgi:hypothetical protein
MVVEKEESAKMSDPIIDVARFGVIEGSREWSEGHPVRGLRRAIATLRKSVNEFEAAARALEPWKGASPLEWKERIGKLANSAVGNLEALASVASAAQARLSEVREEILHSYEPKRRDAAWAVRQAEVRAALRALDPLEVGAVLDVALEGGDAETVEAILDAPGVAPLVDRERRATASAAWARHLDPNGAAEEADLDAALSTFNANLKVGLEVVRQAAELQERDPIAEAAESGEEAAEEVAAD